MILVDTSIWVEFLKQSANYSNEMESILESRKVISIEPVFSELLYGSRSEKERNTILAYWKVLPRIKFTEGSFIESADFANRNNYHNVGVGIIDSVLIKAAMDNNFRIWTLDKILLNCLQNKFIYKTLVEGSKIK
jgi:predicted nucleic acid-binding protein